MTPEALQKITRKHAAVLDEITKIMIRHRVSSSDGETLLLHMAGLSAGNRQQSVNDEDWLEPIILAWAFAAEYGEG